MICAWVPLVSLVQSIAMLHRISLPSDRSLQFSIHAMQYVTPSNVLMYQLSVALAILYKVGTQDSSDLRLHSPTAHPCHQHTQHSTHSPLKNPTKPQPAEPPPSPTMPTRIDRQSCMKARVLSGFDKGAQRRHAIFTHAS